ncbi:MAG: PASTA domain-containing protein [Clostridiales bacterium]|nr:PASTA domain-containing protein [Clostridiales bacterium]
MAPEKNHQQPNRKPEHIRRVNRIVQSRTFILMLILGVAAFIALFFKLYHLQIRQHEELQEKAVTQQTRSTVVTASRGTIYDRSGNIMAISATAETVFLSPKEISEALSDQKTTWTKEFVASHLAQILGVDEATILEKMDRTYSQYEIIKLRADEDVANEVRQFINDNDVSGVYLVTDAKRYYPYGTLASQVIGFVGTDNSGLYGVEAEYEDQLKGQTGMVVTEKNAAGTDVLYQYEQYYDAKNGDNVVLTLDSTVQYYLEKGMEEMVDQFNPANGATGVVLDVTTGGVLGMASFPNYDLNNPSAIYSQKIKATIDQLPADQQPAALSDAQLKQWRNKALNDTYEPGSTFKVLTLAAALDEGVINMDTTFDCSGSITVQGATIHCSNTAGHGHETLVQTVGNSCNPAFITYGLRLGNEKFYDYMQSFGLMDGSGIDLSGEATGIFMDPADFSELDLACYAFGQNFNVTPIALIAAQAACVNGGYLRTPYVVDQVLDSDGNVVKQHDNTPVRQVISEDTSAKVRECLEYVVAQGTGKNGQVSGYRVGGKTGTADKGQTGDVVVSFLCFAPANDPKVMMLITMDTPARDTGTYVSGGNMVAPTSSKIMSEILPYLGVEAEYTAAELLGADATVPNVVGSSLEDAKTKMQNIGFTCKVIGNGDTVTDQTPVGGSIIPGKSTIVLYAGTTKPDTPCTVPDLVGRTASEANTLLTNTGLILKVSGATNGDSSTVHVLSQSEAAGTQVAAGSVVTVQLGDTSVKD